MTDDRGGFRTFLVVWAGQFVSLIGTNLTGFALAVFVYQETGSATQLSLVLLAAQLPQILVTPFAGALVDRWDRRIAMLLSDSGAGVGTLAIALLLFTDRLEIWHLYVILSVSGVFQAFQWPAYSAATTLLVDKAHYGRAAGMVQLAEATGQVAAPAMAAAILAAGGLSAVILTDVATFVVAVVTLLTVRFPRPERSAAGEEGTGSLWRETVFGWTYLKRRPGLLALLGYFSALNLVFGFLGVLVFPLVLGFADEQALGTILSVGAGGMIVGSLLMSVWGGPKHRVLGVILGDVILSAALVFVGLRPSVGLVMASAFIGFVAIPIANGASQAIWQSKVDPDVQGRVFAVRRTLAQISAPVSLILAGPLVDRVFEPLLAPGGALAGSVGGVIGTGPGRGAAFMFIILGFLGLALSMIAYSYPRLRNLERDIPDAVPDTVVAAGDGTGPVPTSAVDAV